MNLSGQQDNRELVNNAKIGVSRPSHMGKFAVFQNLRGQTKLKRGAPKKDSSIRMLSRVAVGEAAPEGVLQECSMGGR